MNGIWVVAEHRQGTLREITREMLAKAAELSRSRSMPLAAVVLAAPGQGFAEQLAPWADEIILCEEERLAQFDQHLYKEIVARLIREREPSMVLAGHTSWGMSFVPALAVRCDLPLVTDCTDVYLDSEQPKAVRQMYGGKVFARVAPAPAGTTLFTVRPGAFRASPPDPPRSGRIVRAPLPDDLLPSPKRFLFLEDSAAGAVDIGQADLLVSMGRGIGEEENIQVVRELAELMGGTLSCSRPIVDKNWLPKYHQVGTSGKSVRPKVYLALGISGAFQHVAGISGAGTVIAVNKDRKAPIFRVADYGVAGDLFAVVEALKKQLKG